MCLALSYQTVLDSLLTSFFLMKFLMKVVQLDELLSVHHSVFVVGDAGTGKSQVRTQST